MKILILGGTGAMGKHLVKILSYNKNNKLYITSRSHHISGDNLQYYLGDAHNMNFICYYRLYVLQHTRVYSTCPAINATHPTIFFIKFSPCLCR